MADVAVPIPAPERQPRRRRRGRRGGCCRPTTSSDDDGDSDSSNSSGSSWWSTDEIWTCNITDDQYCCSSCTVGHPCRDACGPIWGSMRVDSPCYDGPTIIGGCYGDRRCTNRGSGLRGVVGRTCVSGLSRPDAHPTYTRSWRMHRMPMMDNLTRCSNELPIGLAAPGDGAENHASSPSRQERMFSI